jgi:hypothetical protein
MGRRAGECAEFFGAAAGYDSRDESRLDWWAIRRAIATVIPWWRGCSASGCGAECSGGRRFIGWWRKPGVVKPEVDLTDSNVNALFLTERAFL